MEKDFYYYKKLIEGNQLPDDFNQWLMQNEYDETNDCGETLAHIAAFYGNLPVNWTDKREDWLNKSDHGLTVAHIAAVCGTLPTDWTDYTNDWLNKDNDGYTVAYLAARNGSLPKDWTDDPEDWKIQDYADLTIGFIYSNHHKEHYNNPKNLDDYCQNMIDHLYPIVEKEKIASGHANDVNIFLEPFINSIQKQSEDDWMKTSDEYSGFLIDHVESVIDYIQHHLRFVDNIDGDDLILANQIKENIEQASQYIQDEKIRIKEHLFKHHEYKNNSAIKDDKIDLSRSL